MNIEEERAELRADYLQSAQAWRMTAHDRLARARATLAYKAGWFKVGVDRGRHNDHLQDMLDSVRHAAGMARRYAELARTV